MSELVRSTLAGIKTVDDMVRAFGDEERCRRLMESMIWPTGRILSALRIPALDRAGRARYGELAARPGLYQCPNGNCRFQFTVTTRTPPLHSTSCRSALG